jgi:hypothetical protein
MTELEHSPLNPAMVYSLGEHRARIFQILNASAIEIGIELIHAKRNHPGKFMTWVEEELPWGIDKAEKLMSMARAFATVPDEFMDSLPQAWTALYELSRIPPEVLRRAITDGTVTPASTVDQCRDFIKSHNRQTMLPPPEPIDSGPFVDPERPKVSVGVIVTELVTSYDPSDLTEGLRERLLRWAETNDARIVL